MADFVSNQASIPQIGVVGGIARNWIAADGALTRPNNATPYAAHQGIGSATSCIFKWTGFFLRPGQTGLLTGLKLTASVASIATTNMGAIRAHLYNASPGSPPAADAAAFNLLIANTGIELGVVDFSTWNIGGASSDMIDSYGTPIVSNLALVAAAGASDLYAIFEATAAFTPIASAIIKPYISAVLD